MLKSTHTYNHILFLYFAEIMLSNISRKSFLTNLSKNWVNSFRTITATYAQADQSDEHLTPEEPVQDNWDAFTKEFMQNRIEMTPFQRILLGAGSSVAALVDPRRLVPYL